MNIVKDGKPINVYYPPMNIAKRNTRLPSIFLAGTIDMGNSVDWQENTIGLINSLTNRYYNIFNPRRSDWDSSWEQSYENPQFYQQVNWELNAIKSADYVLVYFASGSQSPITLLELGILTATPEKVSVVCEEGFWRKGNVDIVCDIYDIPMFKSIDSWITECL
jgi:hypothetical protein